MSAFDDAHEQAWAFTPGLVPDDSRTKGMKTCSARIPGVYLPATTHTMQRSTSSGTGPTLDSQDWVFSAATGEHLEMHIKYERGLANKGNPADTKFYSAKNPSFYQVSRQEQALDILRNVTTTPPDRGKGVFV